MKIRVSTPLLVVVLVALLANCDRRLSDGQVIDAASAESEWQVIYSNPFGWNALNCLGGPKSKGEEAGGTRDQSDDVLVVNDRTCYSNGGGADREWGDCSNADYNCASDSLVLYAVPRGELMIGKNYFVHGAEFEVVDCGVREDCEVATILIDCEHANPDLCQTRPWKQLFIYSPKRGVLAYGAQTLDPCLVGREAYVGKFVWSGVLNTEFGLLDSRLELPSRGAQDGDLFSDTARAIKQPPLRLRYLQAVASARAASEPCKDVVVE